jgi:signal transduction histidine kinase
MTFTASASGFHLHRDRTPFRGRLTASTVERLRGVRRLVLEDTTTSQDELERLLAEVARVQSAVLVPLQAVDGVHSVLCVGFTRVGAATPEIADVVAAVAPPLSRAVQRMLIIEQERDVLRRLRELEATREEFLHLAAHEIRSPLGAVAVAAEAIRDRGHELSDNQARELAAGIASSVRRVSRLVNDVLDNARVGLIDFQCSFEPMVDFEALVATAASVTGQDRAADLSIAVDVPAVVVGDRVRLEQVVSNIVLNACRYTPPGTPIEVRAGLLDGVVRVRVRDHGYGIAPADVARVFERTGTVSGAGNPACSSAGSGLGLYIARGIVEAHGGRIWLDPTPGGGATFELELPLDPRASRPEGARAPA